MDQEQEDRRPTDSDQPTKKQRLNRPRLPPLQNPNDIMNGLPVNGVDEQQQQAGRRHKRSTKRRTSKKSRKSRRKSRKYRR
jgi:hypothetical protein